MFPWRQVSYLEILVLSILHGSLFDITLWINFHAFTFAVHYNQRSFCTLKFAQFAVLLGLRFKFKFNFNFIYFSTILFIKTIPLFVCI